MVGSKAVWSLRLKGLSPDLQTTHFIVAARRHRVAFGAIVQIKPLRIRRNPLILLELSHLPPCHLSLSPIPASSSHTSDTASATDTPRILAPPRPMADPHGP